MKTRFSQVLRSCLVVLSLVGSATHAQYTSVRLLAKEASAGAGNGMTPQGLATGAGRIAQGCTTEFHPVNGQDSGAVYMWDAKTGKQLKTLYPPAADANSAMEFGAAVAICGNFIVVGAPGADDVFANLGDNRGAIYVFDISTLKLTHKLQDGTFSPGDRWGDSVDMDRMDIVAGAPLSDVPHGLDAGNATVFRIFTGGYVSWSVVPTIPSGAAAPIQAGDNYGHAVRIRNGIVCASSPTAKVGPDAGSGRVYIMDGTTADMNLAQVENPDSLLVVPQGTGDRFGRALSFAGQQDLLIGAPKDGLSTGAFYRCDISDVAVPVLGAKEAGFNAGDEMGSAVAGRSLLPFVSAPLVDNGTALDVGDVRGGLSFQPPNGRDGDRFGHAMALSDGVLAVSAPGDDTNGADAGAVWLLAAPRPVSQGLFGNIAWAYKGNSAPGVGGSFYTAFSQVSVPQNTSAAFPAFRAKLGGPLAKSGFNEGLWEVQGISIVNRNLTGSGLGFFKPGSITQMISNTDETVWAIGKNSSNQRQLTADSANIMNEGQSFAAGVVSKMLDGRADNIAPILPNTESTYGLSFSYKVGTGPGPINQGTDSALIYSNGALVQEGIPTGFPNLNYGQMPVRLTLNSGNTCITASLTGTGATPADNALVLTNFIVPVARKGFPAPTLGTNFSTFLAESLQGSGGFKTMIRATTLTGPGVTASNNEALWSDRSGALALNMRKGTSYAGLPGPVKRFLGFHLSFFTDYLALVQISGPGVTAANDVALVYNRWNGAEPGTFELLLREGDRIPGKDGAKIGVIQKVDFTAGSGNSRYGVLVTLVPEKTAATAANNLAWLIGDTSLGGLNHFALRLPQVVLRKGIFADGPLGKNGYTSFTMASTTLDTGGAGNTGLPHSVNASGADSTLVASYPDKSQAVLTILQPVEGP